MDALDGWGLEVEEGRDMQGGRRKRRGGSEIPTPRLGIPSFVWQAERLSRREARSPPEPCAAAADEGSRGGRPALASTSWRCGKGVWTWFEMGERKREREREREREGGKEGEREGEGEKEAPSSHLGQQLQALPEAPRRVPPVPCLRQPLALLPPPPRGLRGARRAQQDDLRSTHMVVGEGKQQTWGWMAVGTRPMRKRRRT